MPAALIMAAGHGTRMRSRDAEGAPPGLRPSHARMGRRCRARRGRRSRRRGRPARTAAWRRASATGSRSPSSARARARPSAVDAARDLLAERGHDPAALRRPPAHHERPPHPAPARPRGARAPRPRCSPPTTLDPTAYGRIVRDKKGRVDARSSRRRTRPAVSPEHLAIREINLGTYVFNGPALFDALAQGRARRERRALPDGGLPAARRASPPSPTDDISSAAGVNDRADLMAIEEVAQARILERARAQRRDVPQPGHRCDRRVGRDRRGHA